jgi:3-isopropylmalate/(R)-2-methylmalate dehydratase large subunit
VTLRYLGGRSHAPAGESWQRAESYWRTLRSDDDAVFDRVVTIDTTALKPYVSWGVDPGQVVPVAGFVPDPASLDAPAAQAAAERALAYMGLEPGVAVGSIEIDTVFVGSCTNGRIEDIEASAEVLRGHMLADGVRMLVVPGSMEVRAEAESRGLDRVFLVAGAGWRSADCSMCPGMNPDRISAPRRCVSTSNRNYEGRQGPGARTHLARPPSRLLPPSWVGSRLRTNYHRWTCDNGCRILRYGGGTAP